MTTLFRDLAIGDQFDFVDDRRPSFNSFFHRCTKVSARKYSWFVRDWANDDRRLKLIESRVGTINVEVFHVTEENN